MTDNERTAILEANYSNMTKDICEIKESVKAMSNLQTLNHESVMNKFAALETKFVLRSEFKVALTVITAIATIIGIIVYFID